MKSTAYICAKHLTPLERQKVLETRPVQSYTWATCDRCFDIYKDDDRKPCWKVGGNGEAINSTNNKTNDISQKPTIK